LEGCQTGDERERGPREPKEEEFSFWIKKLIKSEHIFHALHLSEIILEINTIFEEESGNISIRVITFNCFSPSLVYSVELQFLFVDPKHYQHAEALGLGVNAYGYVWLVSRPVPSFKKTPHRW
jgi:hypothetical protein